MKAAYFHIGKADADDRALALAKEKGIVPQGCLLGGVVVSKVARSGLDPCGGCNGPRSRCGGRPQDPNFGAMTKSEIADALVDYQAALRGEVPEPGAAAEDVIKKITSPRD